VEWKQCDFYNGFNIALSGLITVLNYKTNLESPKNVFQNKLANLRVPKTMGFDIIKT